MAVRGLIMLMVFVSSMVATCYGEVLFSTLKNTLTVSASPTGDVNLIAGKDSIKVTWGLNTSIPKVDTSAYKRVEVKLCFKKESQLDRPWRKTNDNLAKDKSCQFGVVKKEFNSAGDSVTYTVKKDVPTAHYFIRVYVRDGPDGKQVAYGQSNGLTLIVTGVSGRTASIDIAASIFSSFSVISLAFFFYREKKKAKKEEAKTPN